MCLTSEAGIVPIVALVVEAGAGGIEPCTGNVPEAPGSVQALIRRFVGSTALSFSYVDVLAATYGPRNSECDVGNDLCCWRLPILARQEDANGHLPAEASWAGYSQVESALAAVGEWILRCAVSNAPVLVIHVTGGGFKCCAEVERAAGMLKMACDFRGAPGVLYNILVGSAGPLAFPGPKDIADGTVPVARTLHRMASPVGEWGARILANVGGVCSSSARYFEAVEAVEASLVSHFAAAFFSEMLQQSGTVARSKVNAWAFVMPKEGEILERCEDVVSVHFSGRSFAVSDGATTASYSAEWARALCRHAVESPPPFLQGAGRHVLEEVVKRDVERLSAWLDTALEYWAPEVPWERLLRPSLFNKAKEGSGASLAGVEILADGEAEGVRFRAWALGDSCVIHLRGEQVVSSRPMTSSAKFNHVPTLLMTARGYEAKYVRFWENWESELVPGDMLVLGTDALCEYVLKTFENGDGGEVLAWLGRLQSKASQEQWRGFEEFVVARRADGQMKNDDVALVIMGVNPDGGKS